MPTIRIAVASTPLTATLDEAVPAAIAAVEEAGRLDAQALPAGDRASGTSAAVPRRAGRRPGRA